MTEQELKALPPDGGIVIEVEDKKPETNAADEAADKLQKQLEAAQSAEKAARETADAERQARIAAEQKAREREHEATQFRGQVQSEQLNTITTALEGTGRERDMAKTELKRAMEAGDWDKVAEAQDTLSLANARLVHLESMKASAQPDAKQVVGRVDQPQQQIDPVEQFINSASPATQSWLRQHRDMITRDGRGMPRLDSRVLSAHYAAEHDGIRPDSPEYFQYIEQRVTPQRQEEQQQQPQQQKRNAPVAAPVSRDTSSSSNGNPKNQRITLTRDEVEAAHLYGDPKKTEREREIQYWNDKQALSQEGKIGNYGAH